MASKPRAWLIVLAAAALSGVWARPVAQARLTVANAGGSLAAAERQAFYTPFGNANRLRIQEESFNQELAKIRLQVETGHLTWDLVSTTAINVATGCDEGLFERVDWSTMLDPRVFADVGGVVECGVPYSLITGGLAYDADRIAVGPKTWADFWDVAKWPGKRALLYRAEQTFEVALMADGVPPARATEVLAAPGGVDRALRKLAVLKPHVHWWRNGAEPTALLASGEVAMAYAWNGRVAAANRANKLNLRLELGAGHVSGLQYWAIMKGTRQRDLAIRFIRYAVSAEPQADLARRIDYGPANRDAYPLLDAGAPAMLPAGYMERASLQLGRRYLDFWLSHGDDLLQRFVIFAAR